jgi:phosphoglycolate phosphatase-like HAD superfamily hydrolase
MKLSRRHSLQALTTALAMPSIAGAKAHSIRLVVLDVGGTILQDRGDVVEALRGAMARSDIIANAAEIGPWRGASKRAVIRHFVDQQSKQSELDRQTLALKIYKDFVAQVNEAYKSVPPVSGAEETIRKLRENDYLVGCP